MAQEREITTTITATTTVTLPANPTPKSYAELNPRQKPKEFFGPVGTSIITFVTPVVVYMLFYGCNEVTGCSVPPERNFLQWIGDWPSSAGALWEWKAFGVYVAWYAWMVICWNILPAEWTQGTLLRDGTRVKYKFNGGCGREDLLAEIILLAERPVTDSRPLDLDPHPRYHRRRPCPAWWYRCVCLAVRPLRPPRLGVARHVDLPGRVRVHMVVLLRRAPCLAGQHGHLPLRREYGNLGRACCLTA